MSERVSEAPAGTGPCLRCHPSRLRRGLGTRHRPLHLEFRLVERPWLRKHHCLQKPARTHAQGGEPAAHESRHQPPHNRNVAGGPQQRKVPANSQQQPGEVRLKHGTEADSSSQRPAGRTPQVATDEGKRDQRGRCVTSSSTQIASSIPRPSSQQTVRSDMPSEATKFPATREK